MSGVLKATEIDGDEWHKDVLRAEEHDVYLREHCWNVLHAVCPPNEGQWEREILGFIRLMLFIAFLLAGIFSSWTAACKNSRLFYRSSDGVSCDSLVTSISLRC